MENTCVLTILPVIPDWKIYNSVPKKSVHYCTILKEKREFQAALENALSSVGSKRSSCSIIDKKISTSQHKISLEVVFLNNNSNGFHLCLGLTVSAKYVLKRRNNLLIFLKNNNSNLKYQIQNQNIYVKCDTNVQWNIFYNLFEFLLLKYGISVIGASFYCAILSDYVLDQEKRFLFKTTDIEIHVQSNTPNFTSSVQDCNIRSSLNKKFKNICISSDQNVLIKELPTAGSETITLKILPQSFLKRKIVNEDSLLHCNVLKEKVPKLNECNCLKMLCKCHESKWQLHKSISKPYIKSYTDILLLKGVTTSDELSFAQDDSRFISALENVSTVDDKSSLYDIMKNTVISPEAKSNDLPVNSSFICSQNFHNDSSNHQSGKFSKRVSEIRPKPESLAKAVQLLSDKKEEKENISMLFDDFSDYKKGNMVTSFDMFQTASGKKINVSSTALKAAEKMFSEADEGSSNNREVEKFVQKLNPKKISVPPLHKPVHLSEPVSDNNFNENIDGILVENFFEDFCFDEKETESFNDVPNTHPSASINENKCEKNSPVGKVRKSLGLRRSLKPYAHPKP